MRVRILSSSTRQSSRYMRVCLHLAGSHGGSGRATTGPAQVHTGPAQVHTGPAQVHTGPAQVRTGPPQVHHRSAHLRADEIPVVNRGRGRPRTDCGSAQGCAHQSSRLPDHNPCITVLPRTQPHSASLIITLPDRHDSVIERLQDLF
jgi:hypothetical protein